MRQATADYSSVQWRTGMHMMLLSSGVWAVYRAARVHPAIPPTLHFSHGLDIGLITVEMQLNRVHPNGWQIWHHKADRCVKTLCKRLTV